jgi:hypothetical protein
MFVRMKETFIGKTGIYPAGQLCEVSDTSHLPKGSFEIADPPHEALAGKAIRYSPRDKQIIHGNQKSAPKKK